MIKVGDSFNFLYRFVWVFNIYHLFTLFVDMSLKDILQEGDLKFAEFVTLTVSIDVASEPVTPLAVVSLDPGDTGFPLGFNIKGPPRRKDPTSEILTPP